MNTVYLVYVYCIVHMFHALALSFWPRYQRFIYKIHR